MDTHALRHLNCRQNGIPSGEDWPQTKYHRRGKKYMFDLPLEPIFTFHTNIGHLTTHNMNGGQYNGYSHIPETIILSDGWTLWLFEGKVLVEGFCGEGLGKARRPPLYVP